MKRIEINFNPTDKQVLEATEYMGTRDNYDRVVQLASNGDECATTLFGAWLDYLAERPRSRVWLVHFLLVYRTAKGEVRS